MAGGLDETPGTDGRDEPTVLIDLALEEFERSFVSILDGSVLLMGRETGVVFGLVFKRDAAALLDEDPMEGFGAGLGVGVVAGLEKGLTFRVDCLSSNNSSSSSSESLMKLARSSCAFTASDTLGLGFSAGTTGG